MSQSQHELVEAHRSGFPQPASRDWLVRVWRRAAYVFMKNAGYQTLIGQAFLGGSPLQHFKVSGR